MSLSLSLSIQDKVALCALVQPHVSLCLSWRLLSVVFLLSAPPACLSPGQCSPGLHLANMRLLCWLAVLAHTGQPYPSSTGQHLYQGDGSQGPTEEEASSYLSWLDQAFCQAGNREMVTRWDYITDITEAHEEAMVGLAEEL